MQILGNICLGLALFLYVVPLQMLLLEVGTRRDDGGGAWGAIFVLAPFWVLMTIGLLATTARGGLDWLGQARGLQYLYVIISCIALAVLTFFSLVGKMNPPSQMPVATRLFTGWAVYVFPLVMLGFGLLALNPNLRAGLPPMSYRAPMVLVTGISLLVGFGLLAQWAVHTQEMQNARAERAVAESNERDRNMMARVQSLNATNDFAELLGFANRFENPDIRKAAIEKAQSHPQFTEALARVLSNGWAEQALIYLDACDAPDPRAVANPVRDAIVTLTERAKDAVERTHTFHADDFDWNTRIILSVADKFQTQGVDYVPAIQDYRRALDSQRTRNVELNARRTLDAWLAKHKTVAAQ